MGGVGPFHSQRREKEGRTAAPVRESEALSMERIDKFLPLLGEARARELIKNLRDISRHLNAAQELAEQEAVMIICGDRAARLGPQLSRLEEIYSSKAERMASQLGIKEEEEE